MRKYILLGLISSAWALQVSSQPREDTFALRWTQGYLDIHHILTGSGVCTFAVMPDGTTMLIDPGDIGSRAQRKSNTYLVPTPPYPDSSETTGQRIVEYIRQVLPVPIIDYALITHYHDDHMGAITEVGDALPIKTLIDRSYPANDFPVDLNKAYHTEPSAFLNYQRFIARQQKSNGLIAQQLKVGSTQQIILQHNRSRYPTFLVRGIKANGTIWSGYKDSVITWFTADSVVDSKGNFNENPLSLAIKISYGKFDYFTGGDNTGLQGYGLPGWFDVETPMARAVGHVEVTTLDHHGCRDAVNENFLKYLSPQTIVQQSWSSNHPGEEVVHRMIGDYLYKGPKNIFATEIQEATKEAIGFWLTDNYKSTFGHIVIRVVPGGEKYYVLIFKTINNKVELTKTFGPYECR